MEFESLKDNFPKIPEEMRAMIEKEVDKQVKKEQVPIKGKKIAGKAVAASIAAALVLCGTTVFAGAGIYRMHQQKLGEHGVRISINTEGDAENKTADTVIDGKHAQTEAVVKNVKMDVGYLPKGMVELETGKYSFTKNLAKGGVTMLFYRMDTGDESFEVKQGDVLSSEEFTANGLQGIYLEYPHLYPEEIAFNQRIYVAFTDVHYVMEMYVASDVSKEDAIKIAKNIKLTPAKSTEDGVVVSAMDWSVYQGRLNEPEETEEVQTAMDSTSTISKEKLEHATHAIGESFPIENFSFEVEKGLSAKISDVKISDDLSLLNPSYIEDDMRKEVDENGKLRPATIQYVKYGDMDCLSEVVKSREAPQKLAYVTIEYTNTTKKEMKDVLIFGDMLYIHENNGQMQVVWEEEPDSQDQWQQAVNHGMSDDWEMQYYDIRGGERNNNYIPSIKPGETVTVHMAWVVKEEELGHMYVSLDPCGGGYAFFDSSLKTGYVDIRQ